MRTTALTQMGDVLLDGVIKFKDKGGTDENERGKYAKRAGA